ncbi:MAG: hypothetical protein CMH57_15530 [Myxococcales bacterium]|nr:hypothetical protein [Myxococcales bacterium]
MRGLEALTKGDLESARSRLDEVANLPGESRPVPGLAPEVEARFFELLSGIETSSDEDPYESSMDLTDDGWEDDALEPEVLSGEGSCGCQALRVTALGEPEVDTVSDVTSYEDPETGSFVEVRRDAVHTREQVLETSALDAPTVVDTITTAEVTTTSVVFEGDAELPDEVQEALGWSPDEDREWDECHVEEVRVLRTTLIYRGDSEQAALPAPDACSCEHP